MHLKLFLIFLSVILLDLANAFVASRTSTSALNRLGWEPKPTPAPSTPLGEMELPRRDFTIGIDTCGFISGYSSIPVTCLGQSAYCTNDGMGNMDCCTNEYSSCTKTMFSACLDFSASERGACASKGPRTICCVSELPSCYTLLFSTTASPDKVFSLFQCQTIGGLVSVLATPANHSVTTSSTSTIMSPTIEITSTIPPTTSCSSSPVGAIVGGVLGGIAIIGIAAFLIVLNLIRRRRDERSRHDQPQSQILDGLDSRHDTAQCQQPYNLSAQTQHLNGLNGLNQGHPPQDQQDLQGGPHSLPPPDGFVYHRLGTESRRAELG